MGIDDGGGTPWPTWSDDALLDGIDDDGKEEEGPGGGDDGAGGGDESQQQQQQQQQAVAAGGSQPQHQPQPQPGEFPAASPLTPKLLLHESFETGDFTKYDWSLPTNPATFGSRNVYAWEADRTSIAYDGDYAARAGVLTAPGSQSNLTIVLEGVGVSAGGLLTYAVHAAVEMPVDVLYFSINHQVVRTYDRVTSGVGDAPSSSATGGDWEEDSVLLLPGKHTLTWSYQYHGLPVVGSTTYDPRGTSRCRTTGRTRGRCCCCARAAAASAYPRRPIPRVGPS